MDKDAQSVTQELKPCPLCGSDKVHTATTRVTAENIWSGVECTDCGVEITRMTKAEAIAAWNTRLASQPTSVEDAWRPIEGWVDYDVSDGGSVRHRDSRRILGQFPNYQGYMIVRLNNPRDTARVHRLVAAAFIPNPNKLPVVNHLNNDRADNRASNLEWCTQAENLAHADRQGRMRRNYWAGKRSPSAILSDEQVRDLRGLYAQGGISLEKLGRNFGISKRAAHRCVKLETYSDVR